MLVLETGKLLAVKDMTDIIDTGNTATADTNVDCRISKCEAIKTLYGYFTSLTYDST